MKKIILKIMEKKYRYTDRLYLSKVSYSDCSLADLCDELTILAELRKVYQVNVVAVIEVYGFNWKTMTESEGIDELMKLYKSLVKKILII